MRQVALECRVRINQRADRRKENEVKNEQEPQGVETAAYGPSALNAGLGVFMPRELTAENGAKAALMGMFSMDITVICSDCHSNGPQPGCDVCGGDYYHAERRTVDWTTIKNIYRAAVKHFHPSPNA